MAGRWPCWPAGHLGVAWHGPWIWAVPDWPGTVADGARPGTAQTVLGRAGLGPYQLTTAPSTIKVRNTNLEANEASDNVSRARDADAPRLRAITAPIRVTRGWFPILITR